MSILDICHFFFPPHVQFLVIFSPRKKRLNHDETNLRQKCVNCNKTNSTTKKKTTWIYTWQILHMTNFFSTHLTTDVSDITNQMMGPLLGSPYHSFKSDFSHTWRRFGRVETLHYAAFHTRKCQLEMWARFSPQLIFLSFDYFRQNIWVSIFVQFHFQGIFGAKLDFPPTFLCF